jgi:hypothetical protein
MDSADLGYRRGDHSGDAMKQWGNPEWCPVSCSFRSAQLWNEVNRITVEYINRPENKKIIGDYVFGAKRNELQS